MNRPILSLIILLILMCTACRQEREHATGLAARVGASGAWQLMMTEDGHTIPMPTVGQIPGAVVGGMFSIQDKDGTYRLYSIDQPQQPVTNRRFHRIGYFFTSVTFAQDRPNGELWIVNKQGQNVASVSRTVPYSLAFVHNFSEGKALFATKEGKYGYLDAQGKVVIQPIYDRAFDFSDGRAIVGQTNEEGETGYCTIDTDGKVNAVLSLADVAIDGAFVEGKLLYQELSSGQYGWMNRKLQPTYTFEQTYTYVAPIQEGMVVVGSKEGYGLMTSEGEIVLPTLYEGVCVLGRHTYGIYQKGKWAIDGKDMKRSAPIYDALDMVIPDEIARVKVGNKAYLLHLTKGERLGDVMDEIRIDPIAMGWEPEIFVCHKPQQHSDEPQQTPIAVPEETDTGILKVKSEPKAKQPIENTVGAEEWKNITKNNPFFEEAKRILSNRLEEDDAHNRRMILNYMEHLRMAYVTKDIDFLQQVFSDKALIIVGTVVKYARQQESAFMAPGRVVYQVRTKKQYLEKLREVFRNNRKISLTFSDFQIMRHPTMKSVYGVTLKQGYASDTYSDNGYLFLLWDFRDETAPMIHVRTWQPAVNEDRSVLRKEDIISIQNFNLQ